VSRIPTHKQAPRRRKAIGSIVGTAFFLLILLTGYFYYSIMNQDVAAQERVQSEMRNFDVERAQEKIEIRGNVGAYENDLVLTIKNVGSRPTSIAAVGFYDVAYNSWNYAPSLTIADNPANVLPWRIEVGSTSTFRVHTGGLGEDLTPGAYKIQFLTEKGLIFTVGYP
jgi:hypothetical protein